MAPSILFYQFGSGERIQEMIPISHQRLFFLLRLFGKKTTRLLLITKFFEEQCQLKKICTLEINQQQKKNFDLDVPS
jgi:hypothetical protein